MHIWQTNYEKKKKYFNQISVWFLWYFSKQELMYRNLSLNYKRKQPIFKLAIWLKELRKCQEQNCSESKDTRLIHM